MSFLWLVPALSLAVAIAAWIHARRTARRLERLAEMYWELKYQYSELRAQSGPAAGAGQTGTTSAPTEGFVPLTTLKR